MTLPTLGAPLWYHPKTRDFGYKHGHCAATIAYVHEDGRVNIGYLAQNGEARRAANVPIWDREGERPKVGFCEWAKTDEELKVWGDAETEAARPTAIEPRMPLEPGGFHPNPETRITGITADEHSTF